MNAPERLRPPDLDPIASCPLGTDSGIVVDLTALDRLMPFHMVIDRNGRILRAAPTLCRMRPGQSLVGRSMFDIFEIRRPREASSLPVLLSVDSGRLSLAFREDAHGHFKAVIVPLCGGGALLNLSFGFSLVDAVRAYDLTAGDFSGTDLAIEMLYLFEAKSAALQESRKLNLRLEGAKIAAEEQAFTDTLTGLKNRRAVDHVLAQLMAEKTCFGLLQLDLDHFKQVNDTHGHAAGDAVLQVVANVLVHETRECDLVARAGGDEFILVFHMLANVPILQEIGNRIITRLEKPIAYGYAKLKISGSIGLTTSDRRPYRTKEELLEAADCALYASKSAGRGRVTVAPGDQT